MERKLTFIPQRKAVIGYVFVYEGAVKECENCIFGKVCHNLTPGKVYVVTGLRDKIVKCRMLDEDLRLVEVDYAKIFVVVDPKFALEGIVFRFNPQLCKNILCEKFDECVPHLLSSNEKCKIVKVLDKFICPLTGKQLVQVLVQPHQP